MDYQVWTKEDYGDNYTKVDCGDLAAARREIDKAVRAGQAPILTVEVPYSLAIKVEDVGTEKPKHKVNPKKTETKAEEVPEVEATESKAKPDKGPGVESDREVRRGDEADTEGLDKRSGDHSASNLPGD